MNSLLRAKKFLYNNDLFKALCPYREILKRADDPNFWDDPKNKDFVELVENKIKEIGEKYKKQKTRKEILESNFTSLCFLQCRIERINKNVKELERDFIKPFELLVSNL